MAVMQDAMIVQGQTLARALKSSERHKTRKAGSAIKKSG